MGNLLFPNAGVPWQPGRGDFGGNTVVLFEDEELGKTVAVVAAGDDVGIVAALCAVCLVLDTFSMPVFGGGCALPSPLVFLAAASVLALAVPGCPLL